MSDDDELTDAERGAIGALSGESRVAGGFEDRLVESLRARGLVSARTPARIPPRRALLQLGIAAGLFGSGLGAGLLAARSRGTPLHTPEGGLYLLLLYPGPQFVEGGASDEAARVAEYGAWAGRLQRAGQLVGAEKLKDGARLLERSAPAALEAGPQGFFLIRARDAAEAETIARDCPHLRHGGRVLVQAAERT